jgi:hypothetical protein
MACDHSVHQRQRCKSAESRINLLPGTPLRYCDVDETRDWSRLSDTKAIYFRIGDDNIGNRLRTRKRLSVIHLRKHCEHLNKASRQHEPGRAG